jgi:ligand-binding SRPBCC domain-containing protein|tara:strand:+ start:1153 stop:1683 length:531 start_codon:yes stop_codon:yes gene_type:complete
MPFYRYFKSMKIHEEVITQTISRPAQDVFLFFSRPENLAVITPAKLGFKILTPEPIEMTKGKVIDYAIRLFGFPVYWRTLITDYNPPFRFVDKQIKGPYVLWHHTHTFKEVAGGVEIIDQVRYSIPFGILGEMLHRLWIKKDIKHIFEHRKQIIEDLFSSDQYKKYISPLTCGSAT